MTPSVASLSVVQQREELTVAPDAVAGKKLNVLFATTDPAIRQSMSDLLQECQINAHWAGSIAEVKSAIAHKDVVACFCGFWLVDGTYRDVISHLKRQRTDVPVVIVCAPTCPQEYKDYLASLNIRVFDFICHPYRRDDVERILHSAAALRETSNEASSAVAQLPTLYRDPVAFRKAS